MFKTKLFPSGNYRKNIDGKAKILIDLMICGLVQTLQSQLLESAAGTGFHRLEECSGELIKFPKKNIPDYFSWSHYKRRTNCRSESSTEHMVDVGLNFDGDRKYLGPDY